MKRPYSVYSFDFTEPHMKLKRRWTEDENEKFIIKMGRFIDAKTMPPGSVIEELKRDLGHTRTVPQIRTKVHNIINKKQKLIV